DGDAGANNFPRFLEFWAGRTIRIRGSMVAVMRSQTAWQPYAADYTYRAPNREWGFNDLFGEGIYPPGTPHVRMSKRVQYKDMGASEYEEVKAVVKSGLDGSLTVEDYEKKIDEIRRKYEGS